MKELQTVRVLLRIAYDGTSYCGFQEQKSGVPTIERSLREAIGMLTGEDTKIIGGSRTDAGVHAHDNVAVFDTSSRIPPEKFALALNRYLPPDIRIFHSCETALDFHPRHCSCLKTYVYRIAAMPIEDPLLSRYASWCGFDLDVEKMRKAASYLVGEHDFKSFCSIYTTALTTVRTITGIEILSTAGEKYGMFRSGNPGSVIEIRVEGTGFLYNMVRIIAGSLIEAGRGAMEPDSFPAILAARDRRKAGPTAPARGLTLEKYVFVSDPSKDIDKPFQHDI